MAASAALISLTNTMDNIQNHPRLSTSLDKKQMESLAEKVGFLLEFIESYNYHGGSKEAQILERQITSAAHDAEDEIESNIVDRINAEYNKRHGGFMLDLQKAIQDMHSIQKKIIRARKKGGFKRQQCESAMSAASSRPLTTGKTTMVGFDGYLTRLMELLIGERSDVQVISIVGMGGIGKTTLALNAFQNLLIVQHFDVRVWITVSQKYNVKEILLQALSCLGSEISRELDEKSEDELGEKLHKVLYGRRYLIILDDMWSIEAWDKIKFFFPNNSNRSRVVVTTRLCKVANRFGPSEIAVDFLNDNESWNLFCEKVFSLDDCPHELEEIGKKIVKKCKGLPLSIVVIGGLLCKSSKTYKHWENIAKDTSSTLNSAVDKQCLSILSLSYNHLPAYLKPCFLYLGMFPEDYRFHVSRVIKLWIAEGLIKPNKDQSLEEVGKDIINELVDRNLMLVRIFGLNGKIISCKMHDLVRNLCLSLAEKEKVFYVTRASDTTRELMDTQRHLVVHGNTEETKYLPRVFHTLGSTSLAGPIVVDERAFLSFRSKRLRVLIEGYGESIDTTFEQVNLRFVSYENYKVFLAQTYKLPSTISLLWNVQTLIITGVEVVAPSEIWEMTQLRLFRCRLVRLPDPPPSSKHDGVVMRNLHTLRTVLNFTCSEEVCKRMPNIERLHIFYGHFSEEDMTGLDNCLYNVGQLNKLKALNCEFTKVPNRNDLLQNFTFLSSLEKLTLHNCKLHWDDLTIIGSFPRLEVLRLCMYSVVGPEWSPVEGDFLRLKSLRIDGAQELICWNAESCHFPVLEELVVEYVTKLDEIPIDIGEIPTLKRIHVYDSSISGAVSAIKILEEQESLGNQDLEVCVVYRYDMRLEEFKRKLEVEGLTSRNFRLVGG